MNKNSSKTTVGLVQIGDKFGDQYYLPYSIGLLQSYAQKKLKNPENYCFLLPIYKKDDIDREVKDLLSADIIFFSVYNWNYQNSLEIAKRVKLNAPKCRIVFGGPEVPENKEEMETFLKKHRYIDIGCYGEGEIIFLKILESARQRSWDNVPSIGFLGKEGLFCFNGASERIEDLNEIPSPYLEGTFDPLLAANPNVKWSALIETNRGCPFSCSYCYWGDKTRNKVLQFPQDRVFCEIDWISKNKIQFVFCCDANFGILKRDMAIAKKVAENKEKYGYPEAFSVQNTKNSTASIFEIQKILNDSGLQKGVNLALQSVNQETLESINRSNINNKTYADLQKMFAKNNISTFSDMILALPNESYESFTEGVASVIGSGQHNRIQFINLSILNNTEMSHPDYQSKYGMQIVESINTPHHTSISVHSEISEKQYLVVGTKTMPAKEWVKARVFCWVTSLLHFNKLMQLVFVIMNQVAEVSYRELIEIFMKNTSERKRIAEINETFIKKAKEIQQGSNEYIASEEWLNIWWPVDEYVFIKLCYENGLQQFYDEASDAIEEYIKNKRIELPDGLLGDSIRLNNALIKLPFTNEKEEITLDYNIYDIYRKTLNGEKIHLEKRKCQYQIDRDKNKRKTWEEWCREVVWYGTKKGAYLNECLESNSEPKIENETEQNG
ncbi:MAG: putative Magnesium-protoporphyrin IX monomethyl ester oxidative cyclase [Candidatus Saganbacteria bacterium]|uniref:Putative Magnesium-protoporphyrin IX monomethyl ester oxidative cyclase n=1 Tax=Candidatus Saganbacteria bacterium TaxID=2575572 RepID=A0A833L2M5_UNCSA|nr:MAG: putative Magnesium-protoporphyrin IX monomethyl ester oxidative cyclase [Candidatus Saganbacteria bacterium]